MQNESVDLKIISLYHTGKENEALTLLLETYQRKLYWHIRRLVLTHDNTDDVLQNSMIKIWKGLANFKGESKLFTWLFRIATNEAFTFIEKNKTSKLHVDLESTTHILVTENSLAELVSGDEIQLKLEKAIATLPEKQRAVFHLKYYEELKYEVISEILETSVGALKANYHHAVKKIELFLQTH